MQRLTKHWFRVHPEYAVDCMPQSRHPAQQPIEWTDETNAADRTPLQRRGSIPHNHHPRNILRHHIIQQTSS